MVKLSKVGEISLLELFHGPTLAFKDVAMQFIGNLYEYYLSKKDKKSIWLLQLLEIQEQQP